jgi:iron(III) transport system ATP-binding protein
VGITTCYVTHDQEEALAVSDRIAVMDHGVIQQVGTPMEIYARPANGFVATFIGRSGLLSAAVDRGGLLFADGSRLPLPEGCGAAEGQQVALAVRPEEFSPAEEGLRAVIRSRTFLGRSLNYVLEFGEGVALPGQPPVEYAQDFTGSCRVYEPGETVYLRADPGRANVFTADLSRSLMKGGGGHA